MIKKISFPLQARSIGRLQRWQLKKKVIEKFASKNIVIGVQGWNISDIY